jgi:hypothetical protein
MLYTPEREGLAAAVDETALPTSLHSDPSPGTTRHAAQANIEADGGGRNLHEVGIYWEKKTSLYVYEAR